MKKIIILLLIAIIAGAIIFYTNIEEETTQNQDANNIQDDTQGYTDEELQAITLALEAYDTAIAAGTDLSSGPCISNELMEDWVADIAHNPREEIDNEEENQCSAYREGNAHHFVELDTEGNIIKVY